MSFSLTLMLYDNATKHLKINFLLHGIIYAYPYTQTNGLIATIFDRKQDFIALQISVYF